MGVEQNSAAGTPPGFREVGRQTMVEGLPVFSHPVSDFGGIGRHTPPVHDVASKGLNRA